MIKLGSKEIGSGHPCFIAAEIGINHNGDMDLALKMIEAASKCGVDAVKFQNYYTEDFVIDKDLSYSYMLNGKLFKESQFEMFKRNELSFKQLKFLKEACDKLNLIFFSTPTSKRGLEDLLKLEVILLKNGSDLLVNQSLIKEMARSKIPTVISTGMAYASEIDEAIRAFEEAGGTNLILLHCTSSYPTPNEDVNLLKIDSLFKTFNYPVGFSDHTCGNEAAIAAVAMGKCCFIEKHFTLDKNLPGPDHRFSSDPEEMRNLVDAIRKTESILGTSKIGPTTSEKQNRIKFRLSCAVARDIKVGEVIKEEDIIFLRPATGLHPRFFEFLINKKAAINFKKGQFINTHELI